METVTEISGSQYVKKDHILTNLTDFLANRNLFLFFSDSSQLLPVEAVYSSTGAYFSVNPSFPTSTNELFVYWKHYCFILRLFLYLKSRGSEFLKMNHIPASRHQSFSIFSDIF